MNQYLELDNLHHLTSSFLKNDISEGEYVSSIRDISDDDKLNFAAYVTVAKLKWKSKVYYAPKIPSDGVLPEFNDDDVVGILGDWGSRFQDAFDLLN